MGQELALGLDVGGTSVKVGWITASGEIIHTESLPTDGEKGPDFMINQIKSHLDSRPEKSKLKGIGVGLPGVVRPEGGTVVHPPNLKNWGIVPFGDKLSKATGLPVFCENDANLAAFGEGSYGAGKQTSSFVMVTMGTGVGGGIVINNEIYRGVFGAAGEIGHLSVQYDGPICNCGNSGCIERMIGQKYIVEYALLELPKYRESVLHQIVEKGSLEVKDISEAAGNGDGFSRHILKRTGKLLGHAMVSIMHVLDIRTFIVGGGVSGAGDLVLTPARETMAQFSMGSMKHDIVVLPATLGNSAGMLGSAGLVFKR